MYIHTYIYIHTHIICIYIYIHIYIHIYPNTFAIERMQESKIEQKQATTLVAHECLQEGFRGEKGNGGREGKNMYK